MKYQLALFMICSIIYLIRGQQSGADPVILANPASCTNNADCQAVVPNSRCIVTTTQDGQESLRCACIAAENWLPNDDNTACVLNSAVGQVCTDDNAICTDANSACTYDGSNTGAKRCLCTSGYVTVENADAENTYICGKSLSTGDDANCATCIANEGKCYDLDGDGAMDGCQCVLSRTGDNCEQLHMQVTCTGVEKTICYGPVQTGVDWAAGSKLYADGNEGKATCEGKVVTADTATDDCLEGHNRLVLSLGADDRAMCGTQELAGQNSFRRLETRITVSRTDSNIDYHFDTYCEFKQLSKEEFMGVGVVAAPGNDRGQTHEPDIILSIMDRLGNSLGDSPVVVNGDDIKFGVTLTPEDPVIYTAILVESCMFSTKGVIDLGYNSNNDENTKQLLLDGCPVTEQTTINQFNNWKKVTNDNYKLETGIIMAEKFGSSDVFFMHCVVRICTPDIEDLCAAKLCPDPVEHQGMGRRKRATTYSSDRANNVGLSMALTVKDKAESDSQSGSETVGNLTTSQFAVIIVMMVAAVLVLGIVAVFLLYRARKKQAKVVDYSPEKPQRFAPPRMESNMRI